MRVGVVLEDENGVHGNVCAHFGQCRYFFLADIDKSQKKIVHTRIVPNTAVHGGGGCVAVDEILSYKVTRPGLRCSDIQAACKKRLMTL